MDIPQALYSSLSIDVIVGHNTEQALAGEVVDIPLACIQACILLSQIEGTRRV